MEYTECTGNVFKDLGLPDPETTLLKAELARAVEQGIAARGLTQVQAAALMGLEQPNISLIVRGRLKGFSVECLLECLLALGYEIEVRVRPSTRKELRVVTLPDEEPALTTA